MRLILAGFFAVAVFAGGTSPASAEIGDLTFDSCVSNTGNAAACADLPGSAFDSPAGVAVSPDGKSLYVTAFDSNSISHFLIGPDGRLTFDACFSNDGSGGQCNDVPGTAFSGAVGVAISPNGRSLYASALNSNSVTTFVLDGTGHLSFGGCVSQTGSGGLCTNVPGVTFESPGNVAVRPDSGSVYVSSSISDSLSHFFASPSGQLTYGGCVSIDGSFGACTDVPGSVLSSPNRIAMRPDGNSLYVSSGVSDSISHFFIAPAGQITFGGCLSDNGSGGFCGDIPGSAFDSPGASVVRPDGNSLYVTASASGSVNHFSIAPAGQITFRDCVSNNGSAGTCADVPGAEFNPPGALGTSPDGSSMYVMSSGSDSATRFRVAEAGGLTFVNCLSDFGSPTCGDIPGSVFDGPGSFAVTPDGGSLFAAALTSDSVVRFAAELPPTPADTTPPRVALSAGKSIAGKPVKITVSCDEACSVDLTGTAKPKGSKKGGLKPAGTDLTAGAVATLKLKARGKLRKALRSAGKGKATVNATATDAAGNSADASARVKLK